MNRPAIFTYGLKAKKRVVPQRGRKVISAKWALRMTQRVIDHSLDKAFRKPRS
jgi:hypothetical protein